MSFLRLLLDSVQDLLYFILSSFVQVPPIHGGNVLQLLQGSVLPSVFSLPPAREILQGDMKSRFVFVHYLIDSGVANHDTKVRAHTIALTM